MTWQEWQQTYPRVPIAQPYPEAPQVYLISGRDPLNDGGAATWDPPMAELFKLSDYHVTSDNVHRGSVWIAPRVERDAWTRTEYMNHVCTHEAYYYGLAKRIGLPELERLILTWIGTREYIARNMHDPHLNTIPLAKWDGLHYPIRDLVAARNRERAIMALSWNTTGQPLQPGTICWSMSESVCVAKAVARAMVQPCG